MNKKVMVTGGAGFIGSNLVDLLLTEGFEVVVIDNEASDSHEKPYWNPKCINYKTDICDFETLNNLMNGVQYVFHLAAETKIQECINNPLKTAKTNIIGTCNVLQAAKENKVKRVIYSSTSSAYGMKNTSPLHEEMEVDCINPYSASKVAGEIFCKMYYELYALEVVILRYFNVYGERQPIKGQYAPVIGLFLEQVKNGMNMSIVGDGKQTRDFVNVKDVVDANIKAALSKNPLVLGQIFNVGTGNENSILEISNMIEGKISFIPSREGEIKSSSANISKIKNILEWEPKICLKDWINKNKII